MRLDSSRVKNQDLAGQFFEELQPDALKDAVVGAAAKTSGKAKEGSPQGDGAAAYA